MIWAARRNDRHAGTGFYGLIDRRDACKRDHRRFDYRFLRYGRMGPADARARSSRARVAIVLLLTLFVVVKWWAPRHAKARAANGAAVATFRPAYRWDGFCRSGF